MNNATFDGGGKQSHGWSDATRAEHRRREAKRAAEALVKSRGKKPGLNGFPAVKAQHPPMGGKRKMYARFAKKTFGG